MKYFFLEGEHLVPFEQRDPDMIAAHRRFLQKGYDEGRFLLSGPSIPPTGGVLIARAQSREQLDEFLAEEPFCRAKLMRFCRVIEFDPVQHQPVLAAWFDAI
ncbi:YciI family protein [Bradyrhizobium sp. HKCCYLS1011]|uniref:YciI family protein n=1 Tax=Bradyrhizobium sp. HKCCYLS1011 TaxID=3420733 RepID=UPI003EC0397E